MSVCLSVCLRKNVCGKVYQLYLYLILPDKAYILALAVLVKLKMVLIKQSLGHNRQGDSHQLEGTIKHQNTHLKYINAK